MASQVPMAEDSILRTEARESLDRFPGRDPHPGFNSWKDLFDLQPVPIRAAAK